MGRDKSVIAYWGEEVPYRHMRIRGRHGIAIFFSEGIEFREFSTSSDPVDDSHKGEGLLKWDISVEKQRVRDVIKGGNMIDLGEDGTIWSNTVRFGVACKWSEILWLDGGNERGDG